MTLTEQVRAAEPEANERPETSGPSVKPVRVAARRIRSTAIVALAAVIAAWALFALFEGPVAAAWYHTRQHQLGAEFAAQRAHTGRGSAIAVLQVPRLGINVVVAEGDAPQQLRGGPGHRIGTPLPGDVGNSVIVGHRDGWGGALSRAGGLHTGDLIVAQTYSGGDLRNAVFKVVSEQHVTASDLTPFAGSSDHRLTLVTGTGGQFADGRLVVVAVSGASGKVLAPAPGLRASTPSGSRLWNAEMLLALVGLGGGALVVRAIRRRYRPAVVVAAAVPLAVLGLMGLLLNLDLFLPALR